MFLNSLYEKFLKATFLDLYYDKSYIKYYNFCQQYKDYFITIKAKRQNLILFSTIFSKTKFYSTNYNINKK